MCNYQSQVELISPAMNSSFEMAVATIFQKPYKQVDVRGLSSSDVESLKVDDPFMYYSIASSKNDAMLNKHKSINRAASLIVTEPARNKSGDDSTSMDEDSCIVTRLSRLSVECHADLIYARLLCATNDTDDKQVSDEEEEDYFLSAVVESQAKKQ
ncbi:hypothetical protein ACHAWX_001011 [Stephanocyclus meneghinianus]